MKKTHDISKNAILRTLLIVVTIPLSFVGTDVSVELPIRQELKGPTWGPHFQGLLEEFQVLWSFVVILEALVFENVVDQVFHSHV